jgi:hypothetical protein
VDTVRSGAHQAPRTGANFEGKNGAHNTRKASNGAHQEKHIVRSGAHQERHVKSGAHQGPPNGAHQVIRTNEVPVLPDHP